MRIAGSAVLNLSLRVLSYFTANVRFVFFIDRSAPGTMTGPSTKEALLMRLKQECRSRSLHETRLLDHDNGQYEDGSSWSESFEHLHHTTKQTKWGRKIRTRNRWVASLHPCEAATLPTVFASLSFSLSSLAIHATLHK